MLGIPLIEHTVVDHVELYVVKRRNKVEVVLSGMIKQ